MEYKWTDLTGYSVEAFDGAFGTIEETKGGDGYLVVDTDPWIPGKRILIPSVVIGRVDRKSETVFIDRPAEDIRRAPEFDELSYRQDPDRYHDTANQAFRPPITMQEDLAEKEIERIEEDLEG
jgi:hypothetical protein